MNELKSQSVSRQTTVTLYLVIALLIGVAGYVRSDATFKTTVLMNQQAFRINMAALAETVDSKTADRITVGVFNNYNAQLKQLNPDIKLPPPPTQGK